MKYNTFYKNYSKSISDLLSSIDTNLIDQSVELIKKKIKTNNTVYIAGNGGSASIASHVSVDFVKVAKVKSSTFNNSNLITCFSNDYGYENWLNAAIKYYVKLSDLVILLSVSGESKNLLNAANFCNKEKIKLVTITGANEGNSLSKMGTINYWINSKAYNIVETIQMLILVSIIDKIIGRSEYSSNL